jgi:putative cell wall-binding protein
MSTHLRRPLAILAVAVAGLGIVLAGGPAGHATPSFSFSRFSGSDRYDTAAKIAVATYSKSTSVVIASGAAFPDALAGAYVAGLSGVPILLVQRDSLPTVTANALTTLGATSAVVVGGTSAVGNGVTSALAARNISVNRLAGASRYATSKAVAESGGAGVVGKTPYTLPTGLNTAIVASGENFPDALSAGPLAFARHYPIVLTTSAALHPDAQSTLQTLNIRSVLIVGGTSAVSEATAQSIQAMGIVVNRVAGNDRTDTAAMVADHAIDNLGFVNTSVDLARGDAFADALAGAPHAGKATAPLLLTAGPNSLGLPTRAWFTKRAPTLAAGFILGGTGAISSAVEAEARAAARTTTTTAPGGGGTPVAGGSGGLGLPAGLPVTTPTTTSLVLPTVPVLAPCTPPEQGVGEPFCF